MSRDRKALERRHLETFLRVSGLADRVTEIVDSERPDFLLSVRDVGRVALEHTQPRDGVRAAHSQLLVDLCAEIRHELERRELRLWVHMTLPLISAQALATRRRDQAAFAEALVCMIDRDRAKVQTPWVEYEAAQLGGASIKLKSLVQAHVSECQRPIATWGSKVLAERLSLLEAAILRKAKKLADYRSHVDAEEFWLLVVSGPGLGCLPELLAPELRIHEDFRQIYIIDEFGQHWFPLNAST